MLQIKLLIHQVEYFRRLAHVAEQLVAWHTRVTSRARGSQQVFQTAIGQFHHDNEIAVYNFHSFQREQKRMANRLDMLKCTELLSGRRPGYL